PARSPAVKGTTKRLWPASKFVGVTVKHSCNTNPIAPVFEDVMTRPEIDRRKFIKMAASSGAMTAVPRMEAVSATVEAPPETGIIRQSVSLGVNGKVHKIEVDTRATLLDTLREQLQLFGTKKGCDHGQCG